MLAQGWRLLHIFEGSPSADRDLCLFFDIITHIEDVALVMPSTSVSSRNDAELLARSEQRWAQLITSRQGLPTRFTVLSPGDQQPRVVILTPDSGWGGKGSLGMVVRYDAVIQMNTAGRHVHSAIRILKVKEGSPAALAGLQGGGEEYLLATHDTLFSHGYQELDETLTVRNGLVTPFLVFNSISSSIRVAMVTPSRNWARANRHSSTASPTLQASGDDNNDGALGCDLAVGPTHQLVTDPSLRITLVQNTDYLFPATPSSSNNNSEDIRTIRSPSGETGREGLTSSSTRLEQLLVPNPVNPIFKYLPSSNEESS